MPVASATAERSFSVLRTWSSFNLFTARGSIYCAWKRFPDLRRRDSSSVIKWSNDGWCKKMLQCCFGVSARWSVLRRLKTYVRSTMKNDGLYLPLYWCIFTKILKWTCIKQWRCSYLLRHDGQIVNNFRKFLSIKVMKIVFDSVIWNLEMAPTMLELAINELFVVCYDSTKWNFSNTAIQYFTRIL
jgi:hypothetical protein